MTKTVAKIIIVLAAWAFVLYAKGSYAPFLFSLVLTVGLINTPAGAIASVLMLPVLLFFGVLVDPDGPGTVPGALKIHQINDIFSWACFLLAPLFITLAYKNRKRKASNQIQSN